MNQPEKLRFLSTFMENFVPSLWNVVIEQSFMEPPLHVLFATTTTVTTILFFSCIYLISIYLLDEVLVKKETQRFQDLAIKFSHLEFALGQ